MTTITNTDSADYPQDQSLPTEPLRCPSCGTLISFYSPRSTADLLLRCWKCSNDYDIKLSEGASNYKRRSKRKTPFPPGR